MKIVVFSEGGFGRAVAEKIAEKRYPLVDSRGRYDELIGGADFVGLALWRRYDTLAEEVGEACARAGVRWSSVFLNDQHLFCGPLIVPPGRPCYRCFLRRFLSHHPAADRERAVARMYDKDPGTGIEGFLPPAVEIAAAALLDDVQSPAAGRVLRIDLLTCELVDTRVVPLHACDRCVTVGSDPTVTRRFVRHLVPALKEILR